MPKSAIVMLVVTMVLILVMILGIMLLLKRAMKKPTSNQAFVVTAPEGTRVHFEPFFLLPLIHACEVLDLSVKPLRFMFKGSQGRFLSRDGISLDLDVMFFMNVGRTKDDVLQVAQALGCGEATKPDVMRQLFEARFLEAIQHSLATMTYDELTQERERFKEHLYDTIGKDLNGYVLYNLSVESMKPTPVEDLDDSTISGAEAIAAWTKRLSESKVEVAKQKRNLAMARAEHSLKEKELELLKEQAQRKADAVIHAARQKQRESMTMEERIQEESEQQEREAKRAREEFRAAMGLDDGE